MTTNDANRPSLLGDLAYKFGGAETTATEALGYILSRSDAADAARNALRDAIQAGGVDVGTIARAATEVEIEVEGKQARVDLVGFDEGNAKRLLIEVKFWAGLTENQPNTYLKELLKNPNGKPSALLFVAPVLRQETLWPELLRLAGAGGFSLTAVPSAVGVRSAAVNGGPHRLMLTSWLVLLGKLSAATGDPEKEVRQLQGLCAQQDRAAFLPLRAGEMGPAFSKRATDLHYLYKDVISRLREQKIAGFKGLAAANFVPNFGRYVHLGDDSNGGIADGAWVGVNYEWGAQRRETPFWVMLGYGYRDPKIEEIRERLAAAQQRDGLDYINAERNKWPVSLVPIHLPAGVEYDHVLDSVAGQIKRIGDILAAPAPGMTVKGADGKDE